MPTSAIAAAHATVGTGPLLAGRLLQAAMERPRVQHSAEVRMSPARALQHPQTGGILPLKTEGAGLHQVMAPALSLPGSPTPGQPPPSSPRGTCSFKGRLLNGLKKGDEHTRAPRGLISTLRIPFCDNPARPHHHRLGEPDGLYLLAELRAGRLVFVAGWILIHIRLQLSVPLQAVAGTCQ